MAWCPICKNEYRAGITVCPDCNEELVAELNEEQSADYVLLFQTDDESMKNKVTAYLTHCGIGIKEETVEPEEASEESPSLLYSVFVPQKDAKEAMQEMRTVLYVDAKEKEDGPTAEISRRRSVPEPSTVYVEAKDRYQEYRSSGIMFLVFAVALLIFAILNMTGVISLMNSPLSLILMAILVVVFFGVGIGSLKKTSSLKAEAANEENRTEQLKTYLAEKFPKEVLDAMAEPEMSEEILYLKQLDVMKESVLSDYPGLDESYLDALLEDYYNSIG
ncbi:MAG: hypothetical protein ACI4FZ_09035 [Lachnospiraceae bacterium]